MIAEWLAEGRHRALPVVLLATTIAGWGSRGLKAAQAVPPEDPPSHSVTPATLVPSPTESKFATGARKAPRGGTAVPAVADTRAAAAAGRPHPTSTSNQVRAVGALRDPFKAPPPPQPKLRPDLMPTGLLPPGPRGLIIKQLRLEGIVRQESSHIMIAVVANNSNVAYFLRENEALYDGVVTRIAQGAVYFKENFLDAEGATNSREVVMRLEPTTGESK